MEKYIVSLSVPEKARDSPFSRSKNNVETYCREGHFKTVLSFQDFLSETNIGIRENTGKEKSKVL